MSRKLKGLLAALSLGALASGVYIFAFTRNTGHVSALANPAVLRAQSLGILEQPQDTDADGLNDSEETYWKADFENPDTDGDGFKDGEEVLSGHDPAKKGPHDWLDRSRNITEKMTSLVIGGIYTGDLKPGTPQYDASVQRVAEVVAQQYQENLSFKVDEITLTPQDTQETRLEYLGRMGRIFSHELAPSVEDAGRFLDALSDVPLDDPTVLTKDPKRFTAFATMARVLAQKAGERAVVIAEIPVPLAFSRQHHGLIKIMRGLQRQYELAASIKDDPVQGMVALRSILNIHGNVMPTFLSDFDQRVRTQINP